jgi:hypothetical protein
MKAGCKAGVFLLVVVILMTACATSTPTATPTVAALPTETRTPCISLERHSDGLQDYRGEGFSLLYPVNAKLEITPPNPPATHEIRIIGPDVSVKPRDADWIYAGPGYEIGVRTYDNPDNLDAESWARSYLLTSWQEAKDQGMPMMGIPITDTGEIDEGMVGNSMVASQPAFWANWFAGDSYLRVFYVATGHQVVELSFYDAPLENQPLNEVQQDVYALIMGTFCFNGN